MADFLSRIIEPFVKRNNWTKAQQQQHYKRNYSIWNKQANKYNRQEIPGASDMQDVDATSAADFQQHTGAMNSFIYRTEPNKMAKLQAWRDMSMFPEISFALGEIEDEAINFDVEGEFIELVIKNPRFLQNENIARLLQAEWKYLMYDVLEAHNYINEWFMEYMVDGEIMFEKIIDPLTAKERGIVKVKRLRPEFTHPLWEEIESDRVYEFVHKAENNIIIMPPEMIAYANSGLYRYPDRKTKEVLSFLEVGKLDYRKLRQMEDGLVIYRLTRSTERRVFKIEVGKLPKQKTEQYIQSLMRKYRQRKVYDPNTGEVSQTLDTQSMIEDFWFPSQDGKSSSVETLPGGENLGQIDDILYFLDKLYRSLRIPMSRVKADTGFSLGDTSDITREEVRFNKMVQKFVKRFSSVFLDIFMSHIRLKGYADTYGITEKDFRIKLYSNNLFEEYLETSIMSQRAENFERFISYAEGDPEGGIEPLFSKKWLMKKFLRFNESDIIENDDYIAKEKREHKKYGGSGGGGGSSGSLGGGGGMGGDLGGLGDLGGDSGGGGSDSAGSSSEPSNVDDLLKQEKGGKSDKPDDSGLDSFAE